MNSTEAHVASAASAPALAALRHVFAITIAILGGLFGIVGAGVQEFRAGGLLLLPFLGAPVIEELLKPSGVYLLLVRWPRLLRGRLHIAFLAALAGISFGVIEGLVYVMVYVPDAPGWFVTYRFTVPLALHAVASFIVGLGINQQLLSWARTGSRFPRSSRNLFAAGIALHAIFNVVAFSLAVSGVLDV